MSKEVKLRDKKTGRVFTVNEQVANDPQKLEWLNAEKLNQPKKPKTDQEPKDGGDLSKLKKSELQDAAKDLEGYSDSLTKPELIELLKGAE